MIEYDIGLAKVSSVVISFSDSAPVAQPDIGRNLAESIEARTALAGAR